MNLGVYVKGIVMLEKTFMRTIGVSLLCILNTANAFNIKIDNTVLTQNASQFGNKTANLIELQRIAEELNKDYPTQKLFNVPYFYGISHQAVVNFLTKTQIVTNPEPMLKAIEKKLWEDPELKLVLDIIRRRREGGKAVEVEKPKLSPQAKKLLALIKTIIAQQPSKEYKSLETEPSLSTYEFVMQQWDLFKQQQPPKEKSLTLAAKETLAKIRKAIINAFITNIFLEQDGLDGFLKEAAQSNTLLMVRSTGREDSKELANAGGNESISSVQPEPLLMSIAMGKVVASYFSEKSLNQRLLGKDVHFYDDPFMPILLQYMIGERPKNKDDQIPTSGVIFSQEAEGRTPGVVHIQATFGHNEGVVNGLVAVDTFYVGPTGLIHPLIRIKTERMKTDDSFMLTLYPNPQELHQTPCLGEDTIKDLAFAAKSIESYYGYPVDIEFVFQNNLIYLVQARPISYPHTTPSYLKDIYFSSLDESLKQLVYVISAGGGAVRIIESEKNLIMADNLRQALDIFLNAKNQDDIQAVITAQPAPATSHEATNFRGAGKPIAYLHDQTKLQKWLSDKTFPLLFDTQRGYITTFNPSEQCATLESTCELNAWLLHPIAKKTSTFSKLFPNNQLWHDKAKRIIKEIKKAKYIKKITFPNLFSHLRTSNNKDAIYALLKTLLDRVNAKIIVEEQNQNILQEQGKETNQGLIKQLKTIHEHLILCAIETVETIEQPNLERIAFLYPITFIEALFTQLPTPNVFVVDDSFVSLNKTEKQEEGLMKEFGLEKQEWREYLVQFAKVQQAITDESVSLNWKNFVKHISKLEPEQRSSLAVMLSNIKQLGLMPIWINLWFESQKYEELGFDLEKQEQDYQKTAGALIQEYNAAKELFKKMAAINTKLQTWPADQFEKQENFAKQWEAFKLTFLTYFSSENFGQQYDAAQKLAKFGILMTMNSFVTQFDQSIKALERSHKHYNAILTAKRFKEMLCSYYQLFKCWINIPSIKEDIIAIFPEDRTRNKTFKTIFGYTEHIRNLLNVIPVDTDQFQASPRFNVAAAALGSKSNWARSISGEDLLLQKIIKKTEGKKLLTMEDIFTLLHQNLIFITGLLLKKTELIHLPLPTLPSKTINALKSTSVTLIRGFEKWDQKIDLVGINLEKDTFHYAFNLPVLNHSCTFKLSYNIADKTTILEANFLGQARQRWQKIGDWASLFAQLTDLDFIKEPQVDLERGILTFVVLIKEVSQIDKITAFIKELAGLSVVPEFALTALNPFKSLADMLAQTDEFVEEIIQKLPTIVRKNNSLVAFLPDAIKQVGNNPNNPSIIAFFEQLPFIAQTGSITAKKRLFTMLAQCLYEQSFIIPSRGHEIIQTLQTGLASTDDQNVIEEINRCFLNLNCGVKELHPELIRLIRDIKDKSDTKYQIVITILLRGMTGKYAIKESSYKDTIIAFSKEIVTKNINTPNVELENQSFSLLLNLLSLTQANLFKDLASIASSVVKKWLRGDPKVFYRATSILKEYIKNNAPFPSIDSDDIDKLINGLDLIFKGESFNIKDKAIEACQILIDLPRIGISVSSQQLNRAIDTNIDWIQILLAKEEFYYATLEPLIKLLNEKILALEPDKFKKIEMFLEKANEKVGEYQREDFLKIIQPLQENYPSLWDSIQKKIRGI